MRIVLLERSGTDLSVEHLRADAFEDRTHVTDQMLKFVGGLGVGRPIKFPVIGESRPNKFLRAVDLVDHRLILEHHSDHAQILFELRARFLL